VNLANKVNKKVYLIFQLAIIELKKKTKILVKQ